MRFDPSHWMEIQIGKKTLCPKGRLFLRATQEISVFVSDKGREVLAASGRETDLTLQCPQGAAFWVEGPKGSRAWIYNPSNQPISDVGEEIFTNLDRLAHESGSYQEIQRALRALDLRTMQMQREHSEEMARLRAISAPDFDPETGEVFSPVSAPVSAPVDDPAVVPPAE